MANNEGYVEVISKIKPANRTGFKVADSSDIEYPIDGKVNKKRKEIVTNVNDAIDAIYDIISATPTFWLEDNSKLTSDGVTRLSVNIGTSSPQGDSVKLTITNTTTGAVQTISGLPINSIHSIDLGVISTFGTYNYIVTAVDNFNNPMIVDKIKSSDGSFTNDDNEEVEYQLKFSVVSGSVRLAISSVDRVDDDGNVITINGKSNIYAANVTSDIDKLKTNICVKGTLQYPETSGSGVNITHSAAYNIYTRQVYIKNNSGNFIPVYKYNALKERGITPYGIISYDTLYYKYAVSNVEDAYISIDDYNKNESNYNLKVEDVGIFYDFVKNTTGTGEFIKNGDGINDYELKIGETESDTYDFIPTQIPVDIYDQNGNLYPEHKRLTENIKFTINDAYFLVEGKYRIECVGIINKTTFIEGEEPIIDSPEYSGKVSTNIYPILDNPDAPNAIRVVPIENVPTSVTTDDDINITFMLISSKSNVSRNIKFTAELYYKPDANNDNDIQIKSIIREGCDNLKEQTWNIGRVTKGSGKYYYRIFPKSFDGGVNGDVYEYHFNVTSGNNTSSEYVTEGLVAYWDAQRMSNDMKQPDIWYPVNIQGPDNDRQVTETHDYYIKLYGLNFNTNGWVEYDENTNKHPHLKFTGDSYGLAYRLDTSRKEHPLSVMDLMNSDKIEKYSESTQDKEMSFEIMFRTRCVGEMKACVLSSRTEESNLLSLYTYSDTDKQIANSGITVSYNKAIINSNKEYMTSVYNQDEWKHIVFVINKNTNHTMISKEKTNNYNPFGSMRIYIDGVLTSVTDIPTDGSNNDFDNCIQMVLNGHLDTGSVKNFGTSEIRLIRMYNIALSNEQVVSNYISSIYDPKDKSIIEKRNKDNVNTIPIIYFVRNSKGEDAATGSDGNFRKKGTENTTFQSLMNITSKEDSKKYFVNCTMYYAYPDDDGHMTYITHNNIDVYLQGTSTLQFPVKNLKIRTYQDATEPDPNDPTKTILREVGGKKGAKSFKFLPPNMKSKWTADSTYTLKCDYMESGHLNNTPTAKFYHNVVGELINSGIDANNENVRKLNAKEYRYEQNNISGTHYLDKDGLYKEAPVGYSGTKYNKIEIDQKNSASPARDYYEPVRLSDSTIHYTSSMDANDSFDHVRLIDKNTQIIYTINDNVPSDAKKSYFYDTVNTYYIRRYNEDYSALEWVEYDPTNESHYGKILYKINSKYRDSIDGFPCIVYYTDTYMGYTDDPTDLKDKDNPNLGFKLTLLGTMMFNIDKTGKAMGFEIDPVYENEYNEYLYSKYIEFNIEEETSYTLQEFKEQWFTGNESVSAYRDIILSFEDFYNENNSCYTYVEVDDEEEISEFMSSTDNFILDSEESYYGIINDEYIRYYDMTGPERISVTQWYKREISDEYATIPTYTYDQQYIESNDGEYRHDELSNDYVLADPSYDKTRYKLVFNDYRTYHISKKNNDYIRLGTQCALSYEATTNTRYAAGTFYDIDEAYTQTYEADFINQYHNKYFLKTDGVTPLYVEDHLGNMISPIVNNDGIDTSITIDEFKSLIMGEKSTYHMEAIDLTTWNDPKYKNYFYIDENEAGPYVYIYNGSPVIYSSDIDGKFEIYDKSKYGIVDDKLRYKFALPFKSSVISYKVDGNGTYCYDDSIDKYRKIIDGEPVTTKYKQVHDTTNIITFTINDKRSYIADKLSGDDKSYLKYISGSFEPRYSYVDENSNVTDEINDANKGSYLAMKNLIKWIVESVKDTDDLSSTNTNRFRDEFRKHFDLTYAITYYLQMIVFAQADNAGKNSMWDTWDGRKFYIRPYDMDTQLGLNNKGLFNIPTSAEINISQSPRYFYDNSSTKLGQISNWYTDANHIRYSSYTTSTSRFWNAFAKAFESEIKHAYSILRNSGIYTIDYIINFYKSNTTDIIGEKYYNADMNAKYLSQGDEVAMGKNNAKLDYLGLLMGNRFDQFSKWISERLIFCDTYFNYIENDTLNTQLTIRTETSNSTAAIGISVFSPQYVKISIGSGADVMFTAFIDTESTYTLNGIQYEGTLFTLPITGDNKEISIYGGGNIKEFVNINDLKPSTLEFGNAKKITKLEISGNEHIKTLELKNASYLRELNVSNCVSLKGNLDVSNSINLHTLNISKSGLSGVSLASGGNLKSFIANDTSISTIEFNDLQQLTDINISNSTGIAPITNYIMRGCPLIKSMNLNTFINLNKLEVSNCNSLESISIENNTSLSEFSISNCDNLSLLNLKGCKGTVLRNLDLSTMYGLDVLDITECKSGSNDSHIHIKLPFFKNAELSFNPDLDINNTEYKHRWHNLKVLKCEQSDIAVISYGSDDNTDTVDMSPLNMLSITPRFYQCKKLSKIKGLKFNGSLDNIFRESTIETISDSSIELSDDTLHELFISTPTIRNFQTLNIEPYTKGHSGSLRLDAIFKSSYATSDMLNKMIAVGREYTLTRIGNKSSLPETSDDYDCQNYLVRDTIPRYKITSLFNDTLYVYDLSKKEFRVYDNVLDKNASVTYYRFVSNDEYDAYLDSKYSDLNIKTATGYSLAVFKNKWLANDSSLSNYKKSILSFNDYYNENLNGYGSTYYYNKSGLYIESEINSLGTTGYLSVNPNNVITLTETQVYSNSNITNLASSYNIEGTIARKYNGSEYYRFYNNKWISSSIYTYYNNNEEGLYGEDDEGNKFDIGSIGNELCETFYSYNDDDTVTSRAHRYFRIYNPDIDKNDNVIVYKKNYVETPGDSNYVNSINSICYSANGDITIDGTTFNGLENCANAAFAFFATRSALKQPNMADFSTAFNKFKNLTNATGMFGSAFNETSSINLPSDMLNSCTKLTNASAMFRNTPITGFYSKGKLNYENVLPKSLTNIDSIFKDCSKLIMKNKNLNTLLTGLSKVENAQSAFEKCTNITHMQNEPLKDLTSVKNISSMFAGCKNLKVQMEDPDESNTFIEYMPMTSDSDKAFRLFSTNKDYVVNNANSLFYNCNALTGYIDKYFFGNATDIRLLGCDYGKTKDPYSNDKITNEGGVFCNTSIYSYHEDFLSRLTKLVDVSCLFAKTNPNAVAANRGAVDPISSLHLKMYGYISTQPDGTYKINAGISPNIFANNKLLEDVSYVFAGNHGLERETDSTEIKDFMGVSLPNIFRNCPNIKYMIGTFMGTTINPSQLSYDTNGDIIKNINYNISQKDPVQINTNEFFKVLDDNGSYESINGEKMSGMKNLLSVESLFENSNYRVWDMVNQELKLSSDTFKECNKLTSTRRMFKDNASLSGKDIIPIDLFSPCRKTLQNTSGMFAGCENINGRLPIGDNTILIAYNNYLDDIKNDPDALNIYPKLESLSVGQIFDNAGKGQYSNNIIKSYDTTKGFVYEKILTFDEFRNKYANVKFRVGKSMNANNPTNTKINLKPIITVDNKYTGVSYVNDDNSAPIIQKIKTVYLKDRIRKIVLQTDVGQKKIDDNEKLVTITSSDIGKPVNFALFGEIGTYGINYNEITGTETSTTINIGNESYIISDMSNSKLNYPDNSSFVNILDLNNNYNLKVGKFVKRSLIVTNIEKSSDISNNISIFNKLQLINIYKATQIDSEWNAQLDESNYLSPIYRNKRLIPIDINSDNNSFLSVYPDTDENYLSFVINGSAIAEYDSSLNTDIVYFIDIPVTVDDDINGTTTTYNPGLLGSCVQLSDASYMFAGCVNLNGSIPMDIFSAESPNTYLNKLINISSMFRGSYLLSTTDKGDSNFANPQTMYYRDNNTLNLITNGNYLIPEDWLKFVPNVENVSYLFSRVATISKNSATMVNSPTGESPSDSNTTQREDYIKGAIGIEISNSIFSNKSRIRDASYLFYGSPLFTGTLSNQFLRDSLGSLTNIEAIFGHTSLTSIGSEDGIRMFETANINSKITNVKAAFYNCRYLKSDTSKIPRFYLPNKFSKITDYACCYYSRGNDVKNNNLLNNLSNIEQLMNINYYTIPLPNTTGYEYTSASTGYYVVSIKYDTLFMNSIT